MPRYNVTAQHAGNTGSLTWQTFTTPVNLANHILSAAVNTPGVGVAAGAHWNLVAVDSTGREMLSQNFTLSSSSTGIPAIQSMVSSTVLASSAGFDATQVKSLLLRFTADKELTASRWSFDLLWAAAGAPVAGSVTPPIPPATWTAVPMFGGFATAIEYADPIAADQQINVTVTCRDWKLLTDTKLLTKDYGPSAQYDDVILKDALVTVGLNTDFSNVSHIARKQQVLAKFSNRTISQVFTAIAAATNSNWFIYPDKSVWYFDPHGASAPVAPVALSDKANNVTTFGYLLDSYSVEMYTPVNRQYVQGAPGVTGVYNDLNSQTKYGRILEGIYQDQNISNSDYAAKLAQSLATDAATPNVRLTVRTAIDGIRCGMKLTVENRIWGIATFTVQSMRLRQLNDVYDSLEYTLECGDYLPRLSDIFVSEQQRIQGTNAPIPTVTLMAARAEEPANA